MTAASNQPARKKIGITLVLVLSVITISLARETIAVLNESGRRAEIIHQQAMLQALSTADDLEFTLEALFEAGAYSAARRVVQQKALLDHVHSITVVNHQGTVIASDNALEIGWHLEATSQKLHREAVREARQTGRGSSFNTSGEGSHDWVAIIPIQGGVYGASVPPAVAIVAVDMRWAHAQTARSVQEIILWGAVSTLLLAITLWFVVRQLVAHPIAQLRKAVIKSGTSGELVLPESLPANEIGEIGEVLSTVFHQLGESKSQLARLAMVAERTRNMVIITDPNAKIQWVNDAFTEISGYTLEEVIGRTPGDFLQGPETNPLTVEFMRSRLRQGLGFQTEIVNYRKCGTPYWISMDVQPVRDADGQTHCFIAVEEDISERKQREIELRKLRALYEVASDISNTGGWEVDLTTGRINWTEQTRRIHEVPADFEPTLETALDFYPEDERDRVREVVESTIRECGSYVIENRFHTGKGRQIWVRSMGRAITEGGKVVRVVGSFQDITEEKLAERERDSMIAEIERSRDIAQRQATDLAAQAEQLNAARQLAEAANASKTEFLANMSHEIRTPMTAILGFTDLLPDADTEQRDGYIQTIRRNSEHLLTIINDILDLSKIEAGKMTVEQIPCSPVQIINDVLSIMRVRAEEKRISLTAEYGSSIPEFVTSDPVRLRQIVMNLVGNAIKFTESGSVCVSVSAEDIGDYTSFRVCVRDTGIGIAEDTLNTLFQPFSQADTSMTRRFGGTGLGLQISKRLANLLGGDITVRSALGEGSEFTLQITTRTIRGVATHSPMLLEQMAADSLSFEQHKHRQSRPISSKALDGMLILLAEDGPDNQRLISHILRKAGAEVLLAENGRHALDTIEEHPSIDMVLMDMQMPELDGYDATKQLRELGWTRPIVALTAHAMDGDRAKCIAAGCDDYLTKPVNREILVRTCRRFVELDRKRRDAA